MIISIEDPRQRIPSNANTSYQTNNDDVFPPTIDDKEIFRLSIASQQSSTTTTTTLTSSSSSEDPIVAYSSPPPPVQSQIVTIRQQPRLENNKKIKLFSKFNTNNNHPPSHSESLPTMPSISTSLELDTIINNNVIEIDPYLMCFKSAQDLAIQSDHLQKYEQPTPSTFRFGKSWKKRLVVLVDRIVFIFKSSSKPTHPAREHFLLTQDTFVFVTEEFKKGGYIIELRKPLMKWFIKCETVQQLKTWLEAMKKIVACIKIGYDGLLTKMILDSIKLTDDYRILIPTVSSSIIEKKLYRASLPPTTSSTISVHHTIVTRKHSLNNNTPKRPPPPPPPTPTPPPPPPPAKRQSLAEIPGWESTLPPQLPPPRSKPPPVPSLLPTVSE